MNDDRDERIRRRAYGIWEALGRPEGGHQQHWTQAEAEILADEGTGTGSAPEGAEELDADGAPKRG
ncbi:DUF2934 domain-containing protein [Mycobacterium sp. KBS0706]|uniref:DUF2934 domain-containing protein n=1 Tax=Mycobacterium sp. KBS0706 TaxID=2578109 RepID=UPI00110FEB83|nr:DUF2934 domain-containing protein [Mycobacterium sp. KBS0706]TSD85889.1 DUF2934 domain-containing protein [Mycobacterium sp. KBS0706]